MKLVFKIITPLLITLTNTNYHSSQGHKNKQQQDNEITTYASCVGSIRICRDKDIKFTKIGAVSWHCCFKSQKLEHISHRQ